ncbi:MAG: MmgE/PrpD family protein [Thermaerobacterales bacterium]
MQSSTVTEQLASYAAEIRFEDLPDEVVHAAKRAILDSLGCSIGGARVKQGRFLVDFFSSMGGRPEGLVLATGQKLPLTHAAHINAALANVLDFDDTLGEGHLGATIVPPALAAAGMKKVTGAELLAAVTAGYEVSARIGTAIRPSPERFRLVRGLGTFQVFGAVSAVGHLLNLDSETMRSAFGIAGANAPVPSVYKEGFDDRPVAWVKNNFGWSAQGGVLGALMAQRGYRGQRSFLDGERGFWRIAGSDRCDFDLMTAGLGSEYRVLDNQFKPYSCCRYHHSVLDGVRTLMDRTGGDEVTGVEVRTIWRVGEHMDPRPQDLTDGQYSLPYQIAGHLSGRAERFDWMLRSQLDDPELLKLADRVAYVADDAMEDQFQSVRQLSAAVVMRTAAGEWSETVPHPWGSPANPISDADLERKFRHLTGPALGESAAQLLVDLIWNLDSVGDVGAALAQTLTWEVTA